MAERLSVVLGELAGAYDTLAVPQERQRQDKLRRTAHSKMLPPPGAGQVLDDDERLRLRDEIFTYAAKTCFHLFDHRVIEQIPHTVPDRLREASKHVGALTIRDGYKARELLRHARRIIAPKNLINTGQICLMPICEGVYLVDASETEPDLVCNRCGDRVPFGRWQAWPKQTSDAYVSPEYAATLLGTTVGSIRVRANRGKWRRRQQGREVRYHLGDVVGAAHTVDR